MCVNYVDRSLKCEADNLFETSTECNVFLCEQRFKYGAVSSAPTVEFAHEEFFVEFEKFRNRPKYMQNRCTEIVVASPDLAKPTRRFYRFFRLRETRLCYT